MALVILRGGNDDDDDDANNKRTILASRFNSNSSTIFSHAPTVQAVACFVNDAQTLCAFSATCRWTTEFCSDDVWKYLAGLPSHFRPPSPFPSFQSYYRTYHLRAEDAAEEVSSSIDLADHESPDVAKASKAFASATGGQQCETIRRATAVRNFVCSHEVIRRGQQLTAPGSQGPVNSSYVVRFGRHLRSVHVLLISRPEHIHVGAASHAAPLTTQTTINVKTHSFEALAFMLPGFVINLRMHEQFDDDEETTDHKSLQQQRKEQQENGGGGWLSRTAAAMFGGDDSRSGSKSRKLVRRFVSASKTEHSGVERELARFAVPVHLDELAIGLAANNASCAVL